MSELQNSAASDVHSGTHGNSGGIEIANALQNRFSQIASAWAVKCGPITQGGETGQFPDREAVEQILRHFATVLNRGSAARDAALPAQLLTGHFASNFQLEASLESIRQLRAITFEQVAAEAGRPLSAADEHALRELFDGLISAVVVHYTKHLENQLKDADQLQSSYISYLNHEMRGGMNGILLMAEVLKREIASDPHFSEALEDIDAMRRSAQETVATMDRFVYAHKLNRGLITPRRVPVDLRAVIDDIFSIQKPAAKEKNIELIKDIQSDCRIESDPELLRLILSNLTANAIKHGRRDGGRAVLNIRETDRGGCSFRMIDSGPGIAPQQMDRIFVAGPASPGSKVIRLGLAVSRMAANLLGADLRVESTGVGGTTMRLDVPGQAT